ncbi:hypothetical protein D3C81_1330380 [compost metagenome]
MVLAAAQFLFQGDAPGYFRAEAAVDADHHGQDGDQQKDAGQAVHEHVVPERALIDHIADPALLDLPDLVTRHVGHDLVEDADQDLLVTRCGHGQLVAVGRFAADIKAI